MIDVVYLAWNRLEFTRVTLPLLIRNTNWGRVGRFIIYDDGSTDGTRDHLRGAMELARLALGDLPEAIVGFNVPEIRDRALRSPPATMNDYVRTADAPLFAKVDSDIAVPYGWLDALDDVMRDSPELELLGAQVGMAGGPGDGPYSWTPCSHIGGVGLMRTEAFRSRPPVPEQGRFGFTAWQQAHHLTRGWITPDLRVVQLDLIPDEPYRSLRDRYIELGWAREWPRYADEQRDWWEWVVA